MKYYELTYLISPELSEKEINSLSTEINSLIQKNQGILEKTTPVLKKQLAYPIKKKTTAYLASLNFKIKPEGLEEIKKQIESEPKILRYLILTAIKAKLKVASKTSRVPLVIKKTKEVIPKKKVELKEIGKKLEEILK